MNDRPSMQEAVSVHEKLQLQAASESIIFHSSALLDQIARLKLHIVLRGEDAGEEASHQSRDR